jgi:hypothetical protein
MLKMFKSPLTCSAREINIIRKKLKERYTKIIMLITISIYKEYLPSSPTTAKFEALLPTPILFFYMI